jgi:hypothetical protein
MGHDEAAEAWARCSADRVRRKDPMNVDGVGAVRSEARPGVQAPTEDYQAQRQAVRAAESNTSVQQGLLNELKRTKEAYS